MSTYVYLVCLDHTPPLKAEDESGQHLTDLPRIRAELADRETVAAGLDYHHPDDWDGPGEMPAYFRSHSARFLAKHPTCRVGIRDECGIEHPTEDVT